MPSIINKDDYDCYENCAVVFNIGDYKMHLRTLVVMNHNTSGSRKTLLPE